MTIYITFVYTKKSNLLTETFTSKTPFHFVIIPWGFLWIGMWNYLLTPDLFLENRHFTVTFNISWSSNYEFFSFQGTYMQQIIFCSCLFHALTSIKPSSNPFTALYHNLNQFSSSCHGLNSFRNVNYEATLNMKLDLDKTCPWLEHSDENSGHHTSITFLHIPGYWIIAWICFVKLAASSFINMRCYCPISKTSRQRFQWKSPVCF